MGKLFCVSGKREGEYIFLREDGERLIELRFPVYMDKEERVEAAMELTKAVAACLEVMR